MLKTDLKAEIEILDHKALGRYVHNKILLSLQTRGNLTRAVPKTNKLARSLTLPARRFPFY